MTATECHQDLLSRPQEHQTPSFEDSATTDFSQTGNMSTNPAHQSQSNDESDQQDGSGSQVGSNGTQDGSERHASVTAEPESEKTVLQSLRAPVPEQQILIDSYSYHTTLILRLTPANSNNLNKNDSSPNKNNRNGERKHYHFFLLKEHLKNNSPQHQQPGQQQQPEQQQ
ncbi:hypothetical protein BGZ80_011132 [Entomortierella chlamydospora]|uniref:Uncharacterized protein n=1 Tax=Entomortierella chlamydospora TaxID=101097 RepID=A0A9P6MU15_9FUNG|nr:hypothetical protein BGZ79_007833 [Entomortierella chlamydospora]KAG0013351.1 hypothetical protein BGZ80_011132 [Entomortierella chlamydospora]